jgi:hypothetical protein
MVRTEILTEVAPIVTLVIEEDTQVLGGTPSDLHLDLRVVSLPHTVFLMRGRSAMFEILTRTGGHLQTAT